MIINNILIMLIKIIVSIGICKWYQLNYQLIIISHSLHTTTIIILIVVIVVTNIIQLWN